MKAQRRLWFLLLGAMLAASGGANADSRDCLVGVYYFAGWWPQTPNKCEERGFGWCLWAHGDWSRGFDTYGAKLKTRGTYPSIAGK